LRQRRSSAARVAFAAGSLLVVLSALVSATAGAQTETAPHPPAITDYANYPLGLGIIPPSCTTQAPDTLTGVQFSIDGGTPVDSLRNLTTEQVNAGDRLYMTWTGFAPGCDGIGVGLSRKITPFVYFDVGANQWAQYSAYCGPGGIACAAPYQLSMTLNPTVDVPCYQIDAHLGPQLLDVGPAGTFYTNAQFNMLISAFNGGVTPCDVPPCPTNPAVPAAAIACESTTTTTATTTPSTEPPAPPTTEPPAPPTTGPSGVSPTAVAARPTIAVTGPGSSPIAPAGLLLLVAGAGLVTVAVWLRGTGGRRVR
jgi:hypothetical protein